MTSLWRSLLEGSPDQTCIDHVIYLQSSSNLSIPYLTKWNDILNMYDLSQSVVQVQNIPFSKHFWFSFRYMDRAIDRFLCRYERHCVKKSQFLHNLKWYVLGIEPRILACNKYCNNTAPGRWSYATEENHRIYRFHEGQWNEEHFDFLR